MPGRNYTDNGYRYGYNGKEKDDEVKNASGTQYDYGFRVYDPRLGKFLSVDPLTRTYPYYSPYHFAGNSPILNVDVDGLEPHPYFYLPNWIKPIYLFTGNVEKKVTNANNLAEGVIRAQTVINGQEPNFLQKTDIHLRTLGVYGAKDFFPGSGDVQDAEDTYSNLKEGNFKQAAFSAFFFIPGTDALKGLKFFKFAERVNVKGFASDALLKSHFEKHAAEFGGAFKNADEYLKGAQDFFKAESGDIIQYARKNGDVVRYDAANNVFGVAAKDGSIRTMFKPDKGLDYFKKGAESDLGEEGAKELGKLIKK